ncbi:MAG: LiaI-LiaF-like domain-containing protein [bacterium]
MEKKQRSYLPGIVLILVGTYFLLQRFDFFFIRWRHVYPVLLLGIGAVFLMAIFTKNEKSAVFPATVLLVLGLFFFCRNFDVFSFDYYFYDFRDIWPIFLIAFGLGFIVLFFVKSEDWGVVIPGSILLFFGVIFLLRSARLFYWHDFVDYWPLILIAIGASIILNSMRKKTQ